MAEHQDFPQANFTWEAPEGSTGIGGLRVNRAMRKDGIVQSVSMWKLTPEELLEVVRTGCVYLYALGQHNPVFVTGVSPFRDEPSAPE